MTDLPLMWVMENVKDYVGPKKRLTKIMVCPKCNSPDYVMVKGRWWCLDCDYEPHTENSK